MAIGVGDTPLKGEGQMGRTIGEFPAKAALWRLLGGTGRALLVLAILCSAVRPGQANVETEEARAYFEQAVGHVAAGNLRAAVVELKNALQRDPTNAGARLLLGQVYLRLGDGAAAEKELRTAERYGTPTAQTIVPLGRALLLQRHFEELLDSLGPEAYEPKLGVDIRLLRAEAHAGLGQVEAARAAYEAAARSDAEDARVDLGLARLELQQRNFDAAEDHARAALARTPDLPNAIALLAEVRRLKGDPEGAIALYRSALDGENVAGPTALRIHLGLATAFIALDRREEAEAEVLAAQSLAPGSPLAAYLHALIKLRAGDAEAAREILSTAGPVLENFAPAQFLLGVVYFSAGEYEIARSWLNRHLRTYPENLQARKLSAATLLRIGAVPEAVEALQAGLAQAPDDPQLLLLLGNAYIRSGRPREAEALLQRAADLAPQDPRILSQLAISHLATGQHEEALAALETTLDLGADASAIGYALAFAHLRSGAFKEALQVAQGLRERFPDSVVAANLEGAAYAALGELDNARASFEAVLAIEPEFHQARTNLAALKAQAGDLEGAEDDYLTVLRSDENNAKAMIGLAAVAKHRQEGAEARRWLARAVEANPQAIDPNLALAKDYEAAGELPAAAKQLAELARRHPGEPKVLFELGALQGKLGQREEAVRTYQRLVEATNGSADARLLLAQAEFAAGDAEEARRVLEAALAADPDHLATVDALFRLLQSLEGPEARFAYAERLRRRYPDALWGDQLMGDLHLGAGRYDEAIAAYQKAWAVRPSGGLAIALFRVRTRQGRQRGDLDEASLTSLREWLTQHPGDDTVRLTLAEGLLSLGALDQARREYEALKQSQTTNPVVWNNLAWLYQQAGDGRATAHGERALELAPNQPAIVDTLGWILLDAGEVARATSLLKQAHLAVPASRDIAYHYAVALHRSGDDAAAVEVLQSLLAGEQAFSARAEATELLGKLSP